MTPTEILLFDNNDLHASIPATLLNKITLTPTISFAFNCRQNLACWNAKRFYDWFMPVVFHEIVVTEKEGKHVNGHPGKYPGFYLLMVQASKRTLEMIQKFEPFWVSHRPSKPCAHVS